MIDLRSDTVTRPSSAMRTAMANAEVGDDVIDVDPTVDRLERTTAELLGKEAAIFMPSGSMTNQIAVRIHCGRGSEFLCEEGCHIYNYEQAAFAQLSGVVARTIGGQQGVLRVADLEGKIRPINDHMVQTRLLTIENTHNRASGAIQPCDVVQEVTSWARGNGLATHLDGARLFNAVVATRTDAAVWAQHFDTVSVCFSKGLGAPVGSALAGPKTMIQEARRHRKLFGGAMRQAGIIAAGALYAIQNNIPRMTDDHANAAYLAEVISQCDSLSLVMDPVETNIVIFRVEGNRPSANEFVAQLKDHGVLALATSPDHVRLVTHLDVDRADVEKAAIVIRNTAETFAEKVAGASR